jgi:DNA mismatch endonuclease (patch repair protein)
MAEYAQPAEGSMDTLTPQQRSENMRRIRAVGTGPEAVVRKLLRAAGLKFRRYPKSIPGHPDFIIGGTDVVIFVNGCFWHGHRCIRGRKPKSNTAYWNAKLERNVKRDRRIARVLRQEGWKRVVIWECELKKIPRLGSRLLRLLSA